MRVGRLEWSQLLQWRGLKRWGISLWVGLVLVGVGKRAEAAEGRGSDSKKKRKEKVKEIVEPR